MIPSSTGLSEQRESPAAHRPTAIYGGAFDPVTHAHLAVAGLVAEQGYRVILMPCADLHVFQKRMLPATQRVELLRLGVGDRYEISLLEVESGSSRAVETWPRAIARYGPVFWVIGSDHAQCLHQWHEGKRLMQELPFIVIGRSGHPLAESGKWCLSPPHQFLPSDMGGSSSQVREAIRAGDWAEAARLVTGPVLARIQMNGWYHRQPVDPPLWQALA